MFPYEMAWAEGTPTFDMFISYIKMGVLKGDIIFKSIISLIISLIVAYLFQKVISKIKTTFLGYRVLVLNNIKPLCSIIGSV